MTEDAAPAFPCRICAGATAELLTAVDRNREVDGRSFRYRRCAACGTVQLVDIPEDLARYYAGGYHAIPAPQDLRDRAALEQHKVDLLLAHVAPGRLVEIGPSFGAFALAAKDAGFDVTGIEMDRACCDYLEQVVGVRAIHSSAPEHVLATLPPSRVVALWQVLEHTEHPLRVLAAAARRLEPGGVIAIGVPNPQSLGFRLHGRRWAHLDAPRHLTLVPLATLVQRARPLGLEPAAVTSTDPFSRDCNRFAWEYALRLRPAARRSPWPVVRASQVLEKVMAPIEHRGLRSAAYSLLLRRTTSGPEHVAH